MTTSTPHSSVEQLAPSPSNLNKNQLQQKALIACTLEFKYPEDTPFIECPCITENVSTLERKKKLNENEISNDDLKRELIFKMQAKSATLIARTLIEQAKIPFDRPLDYFAEMVKSDIHMQKLQQHVTKQIDQVKRTELRTKIQYQRKYGKQVRAHVLQERKAKEKSFSKKINEIKKKRKVKVSA
ncbi:rRNA-processing protein and EBNA1-binding protein ebp2 [Coelomomyces lativittatus]|nr:rRNA-processing protein and EBNA1-binding protein ebp2 [Coelomomyces lativittatus]KAJ1511975.1 rRNA-processing protein and EBNA1-binding protein ebp2 [Coelomomyces lativittatus]KAJ1515815.1 rRNA-processing protein and EBNA1-binding protein ebp2 [Coelomomyces lativittatus]